MTDAMYSMSAYVRWALRDAFVAALRSKAFSSDRNDAMSDIYHLCVTYKPGETEIHKASELARKEVKR